MTQPVSPLFNPTPASPLFNPAAAAPGVTEQAQPAVPVDFADALNVAESAPDGEGIDPAEQAALEAKHGKGETLATQYARGALSALLAPGALVGAYHETIGKALGNKTWEDIGRRVGGAATGRSALESLAGIFGEGDMTSAADRARIAIDEQEKAWPLLSAGAQVGGGLAFGLATGGLAQGGAGGLKALAGAAAAEGAGAGAQAAYDVDAPLTEVWTSALIGGTVGAGAGAAAGGVGKLASRARKGDLAKAFTGDGSVLGEIAEARAGKAVGLRGPEYRRLGVERAKQVGRDVLDAHLDDGTPVLPRGAMDAARMDQSELTERLTTALDQTGQKLGALRQRASAFIDESAPELRPSVARLAERFDAEVIGRLDEVASPGAGRQAREARKYLENLSARHGDEMSLEQLFQERLAVDKFDAKFNAKAPEVMNDVRRIMEDQIEETLGMATRRAGMTNDYGELKRMFGSLKEATAASAKASGSDLGNRWLSLSDNMVGVATIAGDLATGGGLSILKGAAAGIGHKILREQGSLMTAALLNRFRRVPVAVDVAVTGGKEAQDAVTAIVRAKKFMQETAERAGANPSARAVAENTAEEVASEELVRLAGKFEAEGWATAARAPSPLARVLYRSQILDTVANDLAPSVERSVAMRPSLDFDIDPRKLARLTKDAEGPEAIGLIQERVRDIADNYTVVGQGVDDAFGNVATDAAQANRLMPELQAALSRLEKADLPEAIAEAHDLARGLERAGATADARSLMGTLGDDVFGEAGRVYRQMTGAPDDVLREMANPAKLRESLKTLELRGELSEKIVAEHRATVAAYEARKRLTGEAMPSEVRREMAALEKAWARGEENVTLDGTRLGRIVNVLDNMTETKVASKVAQVPLERQVAETIKPQLEKVVIPLRRGTGKRAALGGALKGLPRLSAKERIAQYEERLDQLAEAVVNPDNEERSAAIGTAPPEVRTALVQSRDQKLKTLIADMPKPKTDSIHGPSMATLSSDDMRLGTAMWEATMEPLSVFEDFRRGSLDPDKVSYAWKQYPGLQRMAQLGTLDILQSQLSDDERSALPDTVLTQLDLLLGFNGALQSTVSVEFSTRMDQVGQELQQQNATPPPQGRQLDLPTARPSLTERISGARR